MSSIFEATSTVGDDKASQGQQKFMNTYYISMGKDKHPILTPFQFFYLKNNHNPRDIETHTCQKAKLVVKIPSEDNIYTSYNTLRQIAGSYNMLLPPLTEINKENGIC